MRIQTVKPIFLILIDKFINQDVKLSQTANQKIKMRKTKSEMQFNGNLKP